MAVLAAGNMFPQKVVTDIFDKVKGKSTVAKLATTVPVAFAGSDVFTFNMDSDISIVAESGIKPAAGLTVAPVKITPIKVVYQARVTDEFINESEEAQLHILDGFIDGCAKKFATGLDLMAIHGLNPATRTPSSAITSYLDQVQNVVISVGSEDLALDAAIAAIGDYDNTGFAMSKTYAATLGQKVTSEGVRLYPEFQMGGKPTSLAGVALDVNSTVSAANDDLAIVGDWSAFKWGYAKNITIETIEYGDPDGTGVDLKAANQVLLRAEAYIGFAVIAPEAFCRVTSV